MWVGDLLLFAAALCVAVYNVYSRAYLQRYSALLFTTLTMTVGALALAPFAVGVSLMRGLLVLTPLGWTAVLYTGTFGAGIGYFLWVWALERTTPSRAAIFLSLNPLTAMLLGAAFLNEPVTLGGHKDRPYIVIYLPASATSQNAASILWPSGSRTKQP